MRSAEALLPVAAPPRRFTTLVRNRSTAFWLIQLIGWSGYYLAQLVSGLFYPEKMTPEKTIAWAYVLAVAALTGFALSSLLRLVYRRIRDRPPSTVVPTVLISVYLAALTWRLFINGGYVVFMGEHDMLTPWHRMFSGVLISTYLLLCWSALYFGIYYYEAMQKERETVLKATALAQEAQMKMLRYQLNPHFLFNTLNAISTLILDRDNGTANQCVTKLSAFLRHTLDQDPMKKVTLKQELDALDLYLQIEQLRFGPRLKLDWRVDEAALGALVPSLLLQPLIENALKYAIAPSERGGTLHLGGRVIGGRLLMHVADDGPGLPNGVEIGNGRGVGLRNTRERLQVLYGDRARFGAYNTKPGLRIDIEMPAEYAS
jgi:signal transduction histidine kinase